MQCTNCGRQASPGDVICGACGTPLSTAPAQPQARKGSNTTLIVVVVAVAVVALLGVSVGGFFAWRAYSDRDAPIAPAPAATGETESAKGSSAAQQPVGFATPEEALAGSLPADWVFVAATEEAERIVYAIGPPASEYVDMVEVTLQPDGSWLAGEPYPIESDGAAGDVMGPEDEALQVVGEFIYAVQEDRAEDAHALTISPFAEDPASAQYSDGALASFEITDAQMQADGSTVWIWSSEQWSGSTEEYIYVCVPTADGYRISELRVP